MQFDRDKLDQEFLNKYQESNKYDESISESVAGYSSKIIMVVLLLSFLVIMCVLWLLKGFSDKEYEIPLIKSDMRGEVRYKPTDPGGEYIANKDKMIYNTISDKKNKQQPQVVKIMPKVEKPIDRSTLKKTAKSTENSTSKSKIVATSDAKQEKAKNTDGSIKLSKSSNLQKNDNLKEDDNNVDSIVPRLKQTQDNIVVKTKIVKKVEPKRIVKEVVKKQPSYNRKEINEAFNKITLEDLQKKLEKSEVAKLEEKKVQSKVVNEKSYKIQLASFRTPADAGEQWVSLKSKYPDQLQGLKLNIEKVNLGDKGIFYRLRPMGIETITKARKICDKLISKNQGCLVVSD